MILLVMLNTLYEWEESFFKAIVQRKHTEKKNLKINLSTRIKTFFYTRNFMS